MLNVSTPTSHLLYFSVPLVARRLGENVEVSGRTLPEGSEVFIFPYSTHRLSHIYPDPEKFDPERFSPENCESRHPYAYLPFSAGPRKCMGDKFAILEIKTVVSKVLRSYKLMPVPGKTNIEPLFRITLRASGGLWMRLEPRKNNSILVPANTVSQKSETLKNGDLIGLTKKTGMNGINGINSFGGINGISGVKDILVQ